MKVNRQSTEWLPRADEIGFLVIKIFLISALGAFIPSFSEALPLSRFTERVSATGETQEGIDDNQPENIIINRPGFFGKAQTSGTGAALPGASGPYAESLLDMNSGEGGQSAATISYYFGVLVADQPPPPGVTVVPLIIDAVLATEITVRGQGNISDNLAEISVFNGEITERDSIHIIDLADRNVRREARFRIPRWEFDLPDGPLPRVQGVHDLHHPKAPDTANLYDALAVDLLHGQSDPLLGSPAVHETGGQRTAESDGWGGLGPGGNEPHGKEDG